METQDLVVEILDKHSFTYGVGQLDGVADGHNSRHNGDVLVAELYQGPSLWIKINGSKVHVSQRRNHGARRLTAAQEAAERELSVDLAEQGNLEVLDEFIEDLKYAVFEEAYPPTHEPKV